MDSKLLQTFLRIDQIIDDIAHPEKVLEPIDEFRVPMPVKSVEQNLINRIDQLDKFSVKLVEFDLVSVQKMLKLYINKVRTAQSDFGNAELHKHSKGDLLERLENRLLSERSRINEWIVTLEPSDHTIEHIIEFDLKEGWKYDPTPLQPTAKLIRDEYTLLFYLLQQKGGMMNFKGPTQFSKFVSLATGYSWRQIRDNRPDLDDHPTDIQIAHVRAFLNTLLSELEDIETKISE